MSIVDETLASSEQTSRSVRCGPSVVVDSVLCTDFKRAVLDSAGIFRRSISLERMSSAGVDTDPVEYDFVYGYPPLGALPLVEDPTSLLRRERPTQLALYVHFPFCSYSCSFCYFVKQIKPKHSFVDEYLETLSKEIASASQWAVGTRITSVFFGGGTPTYLSSRQLSDLVDRIRSSFDLAPDYEWTVEASPETLDLQKAKVLVARGVNRISIGVQSFLEERLQAVSRGHTTDQAVTAIKSILDSGAQRHNVDLIYGFPGQTVEHVWAELETIARLRLRSVTWYQLWQHMQTPLRREAIRQNRMSAERMLEIKCVIQRAMSAMGFIRDKVDWFVRDLRDGQRQQEHKWSGADFLGLGVSAYGYVDGVYYQNSTDPRIYRARVRAFGWGLGRGAKLTREQIVRRRLALGVKSRDGVDVRVLDLASDLGRAALRATIESLIETGLTAMKGCRLCLTPIGQMYGDGVANALSLTAEDRKAAALWRRY